MGYQQYEARGDVELNWRKPASSYVLLCQGTGKEECPKNVFYFYIANNYLNGVKEVI